MTETGACSASGDTRRLCPRRGQHTRRPRLPAKQPDQCPRYNCRLCPVPVKRETPQRPKRSTGVLPQRYWDTKDPGIERTNHRCAVGQGPQRPTQMNTDSSADRSSLSTVRFPPSPLRLHPLPDGLSGSSSEGSRQSYHLRIVRACIYVHPCQSMVDPDLGETHPSASGRHSVPVLDSGF